MATYSAQCSAVGSFEHADNFKLYVVLTNRDGNPVTNKSYVDYNVYCQVSGYGSIKAKHQLYFWIAGSLIRNEIVNVNVPSPNAYIGIASGSIEVEHESDGKKSIVFEAIISASNYGVYAKINENFELTTIPRASGVSGGSGNIGETTTITVSRASTSFTHTLRYAFGNLSGTIATGVGTSYTWTIPTSFYAQIPNAKSGTGTIYCETYSGSTLVGTKSTTFTATVTEASSRPTVSATLTDTNATTKALTGNASKMVKGKSTGQLVITSSVKNSATIKSITVNGTNVGTAASITKTYANISTASFTIVTTDSRGFTNTSYVLTPSYVDYVPLTLSVTIFRPQPTGTEIQMSYSGNYFNGNFGAKQNSMGMEWYYRVKGSSSWIKGGTITPTFSGNTIVGNTISLGNNYDYQTAYEFYIYAQDHLTSFSATIPVSVGLPIFNWGKDFFNVNVDIRRDNFKIGATLSCVSLDQKGSDFDFNNLNVGDTCSWSLGNVPANAPFNAGRIYCFLQYGIYPVQVAFQYNTNIMAIRTKFSSWTKWNYCGQTTLYENTSGTSGTISNLSESSANFEYIEIFFGDSANGSAVNSVKVYKPNGKVVATTVCSQSGTDIRVNTRKLTISGTSITPSHQQVNFVPGGSTYEVNEQLIYKVVGYR